MRLNDIEKAHMMACNRVFRSSSENIEQDGVRCTHSIPTFCEQYTTVFEIVVACFKDGRRQDP